MTELATDYDIDAAVAAEMARLREEGKLKLEVKIEPRCRVCQDPSTRILVNNLLARMHSYRDVHQILGTSINPARKKQGRGPITQRIIKHHAEQHFALDNPSWAIYRSIGLKREMQLGRDYENGIGETVTHLAFLETVMQRAHEHLIQPTTVVTVGEGMTAAARLAEIERRSTGEMQHAEMMAEVHRIISAVKEVVPPQMWDAISAKVNSDQPIAVPALTARVEEVIDDVFDPGTEADFDDDDEFDG